MPLSPREQRILAGIENRLGESDPALSATFARARLRAAFWRRCPLSARDTWLLVVALLALVVLSPLALQLGAAGLGILTALLIVPWLVSVSRRDGATATTRRGRRDQAPPVAEDRAGGPWGGSD